MHLAAVLPSRQAAHRSQHHLAPCTKTRMRTWHGSWDTCQLVNQRSVDHNMPCLPYSQVSHSHNCLAACLSCSKLNVSRLFLRCSAKPEMFCTIHNLCSSTRCTQSQDSNMGSRSGSLTVHLSTVTISAQEFTLRTACIHMIVNQLESSKHDQQIISWVLFELFASIRCHNNCSAGLPQHSAHHELEPVRFLQLCPHACHQL